MACCMLPVTLKNYTTGLSRFTKFCDDFNVPEPEHMPASECLLSTFVTTHSTGSVGKVVIKTWILGVELWHHVNGAPWIGSAEL